MTKPSLPILLAGVALLCVSAAPAGAASSRKPLPKAEIGYVAIAPDMKLRRMVVHAAKPKGSVLLLHGFPETLHGWKDISLALGDDYDVHAFDWPGFGLSSRPAADRFAYAPSDYARILKQYIVKSRLDRSKLTIYATDIGALPALLAALDEPGIARRIIVGDFAPFDRPQLMYESLRNLKSPATAEHARVYLNKGRDEILANAFRRGLPAEAQFAISPEFRVDMARGWDHGTMTSADAFYHYYSHFTPDQDLLEANIGRLKTPVKVVWGEKDLYIDKTMGVEFAQRARAEFSLLPGIGHYPHLQSPQQVIGEIRASFR